MGADLYITKMDRKKQIRGFEVSQDAVDAGYFRDAYNSYGLFALMSHTLNKTFSWWKLAGRKELFNKQGNMTVKGVKVWAEEINPYLEEFINKNEYFYCDWQDKEKIKPVDKEDIPLIKEHALLLKNFIELAIKNKSTIIFSV